MSCVKSKYKKDGEFIVKNKGQLRILVNFSKSLDCFVMVIETLR